ncbi:MAG: hypothetical protein IJX19_10350 [Clostridia bacterium]|nr:hypothetical protein [Clostridia bacterium]
MRQQNKKTPLVFRVGVVLLCMILFSFHMMGGLYARYSTLDQDSDGARVAAFAFTENLSQQTQDLSISLSPGELVEQAITVRNEGEVTLRCVVSVKNLTGNLPILDQTLASQNIECGDELTFDWDIEWPRDDNSVEYMGKTDVLRIVVTVEQVD